MRIIAIFLERKYPIAIQQRRVWQRFPVLRKLASGGSSSTKARKGTTGVEPVTSRSAVECSATELYPHRLLLVVDVTGLVRYILSHMHKPQRLGRPGRPGMPGKDFAQRGARTHDPGIKSPMLYRLS